MSASERTHAGGCLCGAVRYEIAGPLRGVVACHCGQCRRTSGHHVAATQGFWNNLRLIEDGGLTWYRSSDAAARAFCGVCGSNLFWRRHGGEHVSIFAGSLDQPTGLRMVSHIHAESAGDYYAIADGLPRIAQDDLAPVGDDGYGAGLRSP